MRVAARGGSRSTSAAQPASAAASRAGAGSAATPMPSASEPAGNVAPPAASQIATPDTAVAPTGADGVTVDLAENVDETHRVSPWN